MKVLSKNILKDRFDKFVKDLHTKHFLESNRYIRHKIIYLFSDKDENLKILIPFINTNYFIIFKGIKYRIEVNKFNSSSYELKIISCSF